MDHRQELAARLKASPFTAAAVARATGLSREYVARIRQGKAPGLTLETAALGKGDGAQAPPPTRKALVAALQALEKHWKVWLPPERRALLQTVLEGVTLDVGTPSESTIHWRV
jgi:transcriptional regulator with XRE-family HTH domain